jgi:ABC-2 type transport system ATP-binding protein
MTGRPCDDADMRSVIAGPPSSTPAIETHELSKRFGRTTALAGLSMRVEPGEVFGFLGPNGAGKTTSVKLLLGLTAATSGSGVVLGAPIGDRETRRRIGYLPELFRYQSWLRAREVLRLHAELARLPMPGRTAEVEAALELVGLTDRADDPVGTFSKGMQQRLGLGAALLGKPELVFLDEPTSALDPVGRTEVRQIIRAARDRGVTIFLNSHLLSEVELVCDRVAVVNRGRVVASGTLDELLGEQAVILRVSGLTTEARSGLGAFGTVEADPADPEQITIRPIDPARIPEVVASIVHSGGRIHAVAQGRETLEERFLELLGAPADPEGSAAAHRVVDAGGPP